MCPLCTPAGAIRVKRSSTCWLPYTKPNKTTPLPNPIYWTWSLFQFLHLYTLKGNTWTEWSQRIFCSTVLPSAFKWFIDICILYSTIHFNFSRSFLSLKGQCHEIFVDSRFCLWTIWARYSYTEVFLHILGGVKYVVYNFSKAFSQLKETVL